MPDRPTGPPCGNNPNRPISDRDRAAVDEVRAFLAVRASDGTPPLWERLVQWQPATAAAVALYVRAMPADWSQRVFSVSRPDAALALPPAAYGEQYPDRAPEIAPYDDVTGPESCPACAEASVNCRWHDGFSSGHHDRVQAQLGAARARPDMPLREFMRWEADVAEALDRGQTPPPLPVTVPPALVNSGPGWYEVINPRNATTCIVLVHEDGELYLPEGDDLTQAEFEFAAARGNAHRLVRADGTGLEPPPAAAPSVPADADADLREQVARAIHRYDNHHALSGNDIPSRHHYGEAVAVLAVLPAPADRAAVLTETERTMLAYALDQAQEHIYSRDGFTDEDQAAITSLRRMADETQQAERTFFQPGRTYTSGTTRTTPPAPQWTFQVTAIAESPNGERTALGFLTGATYGYGVWTPHGEDDMAGWVSNEAQQAKVVHGCPPDGSGLTPCCQRTPFELPLTDRISSEASITCTGPTEEPRP